MQIDVRHLTRRYGKVTAVNGLVVTFQSGRVTGLVGPNGAGKSTLLRILAGRESPDEGDVLYDGVSVFLHPQEILPQVGLMPDALPDACTERVTDYLDFYSRAAGLQGEERQRRLDEVIDFTQTKALQQRRLTELSKGMKQRISLARVLLGAPKVLLLDEPAAGLDPRARVELRDDIRRLAERGCTVVISSHILTELEDICDDIVIMEKGRLCRQGSVGHLESESAAVDTARNADSIVVLSFAEAPGEELQSRIKALPHFRDFKPAGRRTLEVTVDDADAFMASLFAEKIPVVTVSRKVKSLEGLFIESTTGEVQ